MRKLLLSLAVVAIVAMSGAFAVVSPASKITKKENVISLNTKNTVNFRGVVNAYSTTKAMLELSDLDTLRGDKDYTIYLVLDTPGGSISDGMAFIEFAKNIKNLKTITIFAASMGSAIVEHLPGERLILESGTLMFHRAAGRFEGQFNDGEVESQLAYWKALVTSLEQVNADRMGMSLEVYKGKVLNELWIFGKDNVKQNAADRIVSITCSKDLVKETEIAKMESLFFSLDATFSKCPLFSQPLSIEKGE